MAAKSNSLGKIVLITSPISQIEKGIESFDYFAALVTLLSKRLQKNYKDADIILKTATNSTDYHSEQVEYIKQASSRSEIDYIIVSPVDVTLFYNELGEEYLKKLISERRIIFIDQGFDYLDKESLKKVKESRNEFPPYVQADWIQGGEVAAESAMKYLEELGIKSPHIVIIEGGVGSFERVKGFVDCIEKKQKQSGSSFYPLIYKANARYSRTLAKSFFLSYLREAIASQNPIDLIFTTNDEMGIGVREALFELQDDYDSKIAVNRKKQVPKIIGFDGIRDFTILIDKTQKDFVYDTVLVDLDTQIEKILFILANHNRLEKSNVVNDEKKIQVTIGCDSFRNKYKNDFKK